MRNYLVILLVATCFYAVAKPNIVFILTDDRGAETCVPDGGSWTTPNIDSIATDGMRFSNMHSYETCAPSRATLLTGRYSDLRMDPPIDSPGLTFGVMDTNEVTLADILGDVGYTTALAGKWNLRFTSEDDTQANRDIQRTHIQDCGFDTNFTFIGHTIDYWAVDGNYAETNYIPYQVNQWALDFLDTNGTNSAPFYLQYSFGLVHRPIGVTPYTVALTNETDRNVLIVGMYEYMDICVSNVLAKLDALGIASNTIVIYSGDNGTDTLLTSTYNGTGIAGGKGTEGETATRVPFYVRWPGVVATNAAYTGLISYVDIMPTIAEACGASLPRERLIDGRSYYNALLGLSQIDRPYMYRGGNLSSHKSAKDSDWKYIPNLNVLYSTTNWPYGDIVVDPASSQVAANAYLRLKLQYANEINRTYGVGFNGLTNENVLVVFP